MKKKTHEEYIDELKIKNSNIEVIEKYNGAGKKILHKCIVCEHEWNVTPSALLSMGHGCPKCASKVNADKLRKTQEEFLIDLYKINKNVEVLGTYNTALSPIEIKCLKCDGIWFPQPSRLLNGQGCPYCGVLTKAILVGVNDIRSTLPDISKLLLNSEDGLKYSKGSSVKVDWKCPCCNSIIRNKSISKITSRGKLPCSICSDGVSYPNKMMFSLLSQLNIEFETEKSFTWSKLDINSKYSKARYDFYFKVTNEEYLIEMDGNWHNVDNKISGVSKEKSKAIDFLKDQLAFDHEIKLIRVDCQKSDVDYIKNNILNSELSLILDLRNVDWLKCHKESISSYKVKAASLWNRGLLTGEIAKVFKRDKSTVIGWLKDCNRAELCDYDANSWKKRVVRRPKPSNSQNVICVETGCIYKSINDASRSTGIHSSSISSCCRKINKTAGGLRWEYVS